MIQEKQILKTSEKDWFSTDGGMWTKTTTTQVLTIPKEVLEQLVPPRVQDKIKSLEAEIKKLKERQHKLPNDAALSLLRIEIRKLKESGVKQIDIIDLYNKTKLPLEQITELMNTLEKEGVVTSTDA